MLQSCRPTFQATKRYSTLSFKRHISWRIISCVCGHCIPVTWTLAAWWRSGAKRFWHRRFSRGKRADIPIILNSFASVTLRHRWHRLRPICMQFKQKLPCAVTVSTLRKLSLPQLRYLSWLLAGNSSTNGNTWSPSCAFAILHGSRISSRCLCPNRILCFSLFSARSRNGKSNIEGLLCGNSYCRCGAGPVHKLSFVIRQQIVCRYIPSN